MRIVNDNPDIDAWDLVDTERGSGPGRKRKIVIVTAVAVLAPFLFVALYLGNRPPMSPEEIVVLSASEARMAAGQVEVTTLQSQVQKFSPPAVDKTPADGAPTLTETELTGLGNQAAQVAARRVNQDTLRDIATVQASVKKPLAAEQRLTGASEQTARDLPILQVKKSNSNLRANPSIDSQVVTQLSPGSTVTVFSRRGDWVQVGVNDGRAFTGYIHKSLLGIVSN